MLIIMTMLIGLFNPSSHTGHAMNKDLQHFLMPLLRVVTGTLFAVFTVAFLSIPYVLQQHPGESSTHAPQTGTRHMT
jgi:hypothetical protein